MKRTYMATELTLEQEGQQVVLNGWVDTRRDHGGLIFIDLRDRSGLIQVVFSPEVNREAFHLAEQVRSEYVIAVSGIVRKDRQLLRILIWLPVKLKYMLSRWKYSVRPRLLLFILKMV